MNNKGITLVALVVMIIILLILSGTAIYSGYDAIEKSKEQKFLTQLKEINEAVKLHLNDLKEETSQNQIILETENDYNKIELSGITDKVRVNLDTGEIYSIEGLNEKHTLRDFGIEYYKPQHEQTSNNITVNFQIEQLKDWKFIVKDNNIICNGNVLDGNLLYSEYIDGNEHNWKRVLNRTTVEVERTRI